MFKNKLPAINDIEGDRVPKSFPFIIDAHVHIFPDGIFKSVWKWFDKYGYPIRYKFNALDLLNFLLLHGISHIIALQYAHKPGISNGLNQFMAEVCSRFPQKVTGMATVFPGEKGAGDILKNAFDMGLKGVKLHAHVQCFDMNSRDMNPIYELCSYENMPIVMHAGREPSSPAYLCNPYSLCSAEKLEQVIKSYPDLKICVPHLGVNEYLEYKQLIEKYDNLWLDTAMVMTDYFPGNKPFPLNEMRADRIMYGSDFPNIPFAWDRELKQIEKLEIPNNILNLVLGKNACEFFSIPEPEGL
ncbi:Metal-dependent hydrolase, amidohydrolase-related [Desulfonema limicola]|uniref:Metal-dependent hydrolase, amidohydrolase-related n=2 Tax=Desulfonema limicola TaxID=45656 RepID=A0A975B343_9BACT|nr:Metal-dependent hydrolase, amidohydrolase-related [Desulfonema limicola]